MDVDAGVEEKKGEERSTPAAAAVSAERTQKGKGEGDRNIMLHPVCSALALSLCSQVDKSTAARICSRGQAVGFLNS